MEFVAKPLPVVHRATICVHGNDTCVDGRASRKRIYVPLLAKASVAIGADGLITKVHQSPSQERFDGH